MTSNIAKATRTVDISSLAPFPDGDFEEAIVSGLKSAVAKGHRLRVRILVGAAPIYRSDVVPAMYRNELVRKLGSAADSLTLNIASMTASKTAVSWNHSKLLVVDADTVIAGGINDWKDYYTDTAHPVVDVDLALAGPAARSAANYLDTLWTWTCSHSANPLMVWLASSKNTACMPTLEKDANPVPPKAAGSVPVIGVGGLGAGIQDTDPASTLRLDPPVASDTTCVPGLHDRTNSDRDYATVNPEESALTTLVASARTHLEISQQDLNATCPPMPRYDFRLYAALAAKIAAGVKVRIVVSDPANRGGLSGGYSQIKSLSEISDLLRDRLTSITGNSDMARRTICTNLQLASFRQSMEPNWADGHPYPLHHKLISVDDSAFYIGSKNLYPAWLQDFGYIVEDQAAATQLKEELLDPEWRYSQATATIDYKRGICLA
ncbi:phospholipase D-like domain-containing protein [Streptomyces sp. NPDC059680]|uniref:phospholipase D-like domain-containing protein n=1 Tax=Streptomyces sp. NPDC059680 TaxID=3346904 RepID=UPI0036C2E247